MKSYEDFTRASEDELYDYKELVGEAMAHTINISAKLKKENREEKEKLVKVYQWGE